MIHSMVPNHQAVVISMGLYFPFQWDYKYLPSGYVNSLLLNMAQVEIVSFPH